MAKYTVKIKTKHDHIGNGPSKLKIVMEGDRKILQNIEFLVLNYEELEKDLGAIQRLKKYAGTVLGKGEEHFMSRREID